MSENIELSVIFGLIACVIGVISFFTGKQATAKKDGSQWGELLADVKHIKEDMVEVKAQYKVINTQYSDLKTETEIIKRDLKTAFNKIDDLKVQK